MKPFDANGWTILFYTDFQLQWADLTAKVVKLKSKLEPKDFVTHPDVKLLKAIDSGIRDKISVDPFASQSTGGERSYLDLSGLSKGGSNRGKPTLRDILKLIIRNRPQSFE
jgi:hypothetical protein